MKVDRFWTVYRMRDGITGRRHSTRQAAFVEAEQLATEKLDETFVLLEAKQAYRVTVPSMTSVDCE